MPASGPCAPWTSGPQIAALPWVAAAAGKAISERGYTQQQIDFICAGSAAAASEILYELSGRLFTGECGPVTVRPLARPADADTRGWGSRSPLGWFSAWGAGSWFGFSNPGISAMYFASNPPTVVLPHPVNQIVQVKIDGTVIPPDEYELRAGHDLVRIRPTSGFSPTARWGWPTSQIGDLPDTQQGTFSVTFMFGQVPPASGQLAALKLAEYIALPQLGDSTRYPRRTTQVARQGVTAQTTDVQDILRSGSLGIWEVDAFLLAVNPKKLQRQASVWSPDIGRPARQANPSIP